LLSESERIGFPDALRAGAEDRILESISGLLGLENARGLRVVDIGCGCGVLARRIIELCRERSHDLVLVDSAEMLGQHDDDAAIRKVTGRFPTTAPLLDFCAGRADAVIVYSVLHYVFAEGDADEFVEGALALLAPGGRILFGDLPNESKRRRFFASDAGAAYHRAFMATDDPPPVNEMKDTMIDDAAILRLVSRARERGFDAYVLPQPDDLPFANRREDVLVRRP
jgi:SAM-dependent methyltransferase